MTTTNILDSVSTALPPLRMNTSTGYTGEQLRNDIVSYLSPIHKRNVNAGCGAGTYVHGITAVDQAYIGGVYSPTQNRIYFVPYTQANETNWHYIDCNTGTVVAYQNNSGVAAVDMGYWGGVYSPTQNRIYLVPYIQASATNWHYIDCNTGAVVAYTHTGITAVSGAYQGGAYSPTQNRIYLFPYYQSDKTNWHYIDCTSTGSVVAYQNNSGVAAVGYGYTGGVYSPTQNRIYLVPRIQAIQDNWHYIDCTSTGSVHAYAHGVTANTYIGGVYSPTQNRIYLVPYGQANPANTNWHYIDCNDGTVHAYAHGVTTVTSAYMGGVYSPTQNRIYLVPSVQAHPSYTNWHYIDCTSTGSVHAYAHGVTTVSGAYVGGVYSPTQNRIYLVPYGQADVANWHYIQEFSKDRVSAQLMSGALFNKL